MPTFLTTEPAIASQVRYLAEVSDREGLHNMIGSIDSMIIAQDDMYLTVAERSPNSIYALDVIRDRSAEYRAIRAEAQRLIGEVREREADGRLVPDPSIHPHDIFIHAPREVPNAN